MTGTSFRVRLAQVVKAVGSAAELARRSGMSDRSIRSYLAGDTEPKGEVIVRLAAAGAVRVEWLLTGAEPMEAEPPKAEQPAAGYRLDIAEAVIIGLDEFLKETGWECTNKEWETLIDVARRYMERMGSTDREVLFRFLRTITRDQRVAAQPVAGAPVSDETPSVDMVRTRRDGDVPAPPPAKQKKGEK